LTNIKRCPVTGSFECLEKNVTVLINLYEKGDKSVLEAILDVAVISDGYLAAGIGSFLSDVINHDTEEFLIAIKGRPKNEQRTLAMLAVVGDGGGHTDDWNKSVGERLNFQAQASDKKLSDVSRLCLRTLRKSIARRDSN
jgi:hypothetical protein